MLKMKKKVEVVEVNLVQGNAVTQFDLRIETTMKKRRLRPWVKKAIVGIVIAVVMFVFAWFAIDNVIVFEDEVEWVEQMALDGDGYDRLVRRANGDAVLDLKDMVTMAEYENDYASLQAGNMYMVPVLKEEK